MTPNCADKPLGFIVGEDEAGVRLDAFLASRLGQYSRVQLRRAISASGVTVDGKRAKPAYRLKAGQRVGVKVPETGSPGPEPEDIPLEILYEDDMLVVVNKPPGMVVHPAKGHWSGTLASALSYHFTRLSTAGGPTRPGIVHRLDRETSGVIVVAKTNEVHLALAAQFEARSVRKEYLAVVQGIPDRDRDVIEQPIGDHPYQREKMAIRSGHSTSRDARTTYEVTERFSRFAALRLMPHTGRTHQIRLHLAHAGCPVLCDRLYGGRATITRGEISGDRQDTTVLLDRLALHAHRLHIAHPATGSPIEFTAPIPRDIDVLLKTLRSFAFSV